MGLLDSLLGRSKPVKPDLDALFAIPNAALTLQAGGDINATGLGSVCFKAAEGAAFAEAQSSVEQLLDADNGPKVEQSKDEFGFTWLLCRHEPADVPGLVTDLHAVNSSLEGAGFGPSLLCSVVGFTGPESRRLGLVYLYKRGTFYPFGPLAGEKQRRDNPFELQVRALLGADLPVESDLSRWFPVWGAPGL